jgi:1-deoxy-D-xylulose-5-phosphate synthase
MLEKLDIHVVVLKLNRIKPIDENCFKICGLYKKIIFFEEGIKAGGIGEHFGMGLFDHKIIACYNVHAIDDKYVSQGDASRLISSLGLDADSMVKEVIKICDAD